MSLDFVFLLARLEEHLDGSREQILAEDLVPINRILSLYKIA